MISEGVGSYFTCSLLVAVSSQTHCWLASRKIGSPSQLQHSISNIQTLNRASIDGFILHVLLA